MSLKPKKIYRDLERGEIDKSTAVDLLIYLIKNNDLIDLREECIETLVKVDFKNDKVFSVLENMLVSDPNLEIRVLAVKSLKSIFQEKAIAPLIWALDHEKSWQLAIEIVSIIEELDNIKTNAILFKKIKKIDDYKFLKSLGRILNTKDIQTLKSKNLAEIIRNYIVINHFKDNLKEFSYYIKDGLVLEIDLSFISEKPNGWKVLKHLSEFITVMDNLIKLELKSNKIGKFPDSVFSLKSLKFLDLSHNEISKLPDQFITLQSIEILNLRHNKLSTLPSSIGTLINIKKLDLKHNKLVKLPPSIGNLSSLEILNLHGNQLKSLPTSIKDLFSLKKLNLGLNNLKNIPKWIKNLSSLKKLSLGGNKNLPILEEWITNLPPIVELNLYDNGIKTIPDSIGSLDSLEVIILPNNHISSLPESLKDLKSLKKLDLGWNFLTSLPEWVQSLSALEELNLRGNKLSKIPETLYNLPSLKVLNISSNKNPIYPPKGIERKGLQIIF